MSSIGHGNPGAAYDFYQRIKQVVQIAVPVQRACSRGPSDMSAVWIEQEVAAPLRGKRHDERVMDAPVSLCPTVTTGLQPCCQSSARGKSCFQMQNNALHRET